MEKKSSNSTSDNTAESPRPVQLTSNLTLIFRVFLPVFGTVFFTGLLLALWLTDPEDLYLPYSIWWPRSVVLVIWLAWLFFAKKRFWPLKRVDADPEHFFVTNYWTTVRYNWADVESMEEFKKWKRRVVHLRLRAPGRFGQTIVFLPGSNFDNWMQTTGKSELINRQD